MARSWMPRVTRSAPGCCELPDSAFPELMVVGTERCRNSLNPWETDGGYDLWGYWGYFVREHSLLCVCMSFCGAWWVDFLVTWRNYHDSLSRHVRRYPFLRGTIKPYQISTHTWHQEPSQHSIMVKKMSKRLFKMNTVKPLMTPAVAGT